jgi:hypothetical protein
LDREGSTRLERRTAIVAEELKRFRISIAALQETRFDGAGILHEAASGYTFFWSGCDAATIPRRHGVAFAIRDDICSSLQSQPLAVNSRLIVMELPMRGKVTSCTSIICAYAPTLDSDDEVKQRFYVDLDRLLSKVPKRNKIVLLGDLNARVGTSTLGWEKVIGSNGMGNRNSNGDLLLELCAKHELCITNTIFRQSNTRKGTWMHPRSKHHHILDYAIVRQRDLRDVCSTRVMRSANCSTDHHMLRCKLRFSVKRKRHVPADPMRILDTQSLRSPDVNAAFVEAIRVSCIDNDPSDVVIDELKAFKEMVCGAAQLSLQKRTKRSKDWFIDVHGEILHLLSAKNAAHQTALHHPSELHRNQFRRLRGYAQTEIRRLKNQWWSSKAEQLQSFIDRNDYASFFGGLKQVYGPTIRGQTTLLDTNGTTLLVDSRAVMQRWHSHFSELLNRPSSADIAWFSQLPQEPPILILDDPPTLVEVGIAIKQIHAGRAPGSDEIRPELFHALGIHGLQRLHNLFLLVWDAGSVPQEWKDARLVTIFKNKGSRTDPGNFRGISLLSIAGKIFARVLLNRLNLHISERIAPESQS